MLKNEVLPGIQAGQGVNLALGTTHNTAVTGTFQPSVPGASGLDVDYSLTVLKSTDDMVRALSVSASLSYSSIFFSAGATADFFQRSSVSRYTTYVLAKCTVTLPPQSIPRPKIDPAVITAAQSLSKDEFCRIYGTSFFAGFIGGGTYYGVIEIESASEDQQQDIAVAVSGAGWGISASASVSDRLSRISATLSKRVYAIRRGVGAGPNPLTADDIINQCVNFPQEVTSSPVAFLGLFQPYDDMAVLQFKPTAGAFETAQRQADLQLLGQRFAKLLQFRNDYNYVLIHYNDYQLGSGVVFKVAGEAIVNKPLSSLTPAQLSNLRVASDSDEVPATLSLSLTVQAISDELSNIQTSLTAVQKAADACQAGQSYAIPPAYVAKVGLPDIKGRNMELDMIKASLVPTGTIVIWSGPAESIPEGWALCDGQQGRPDLRDRFVCGAGPGGPNPLTMGDGDAHTHHVDPPAITANTTSAPDHGHLLPGSWYFRRYAEGGFNGIDCNQETPPNASVRPGGGHSHQVTISFDDFQTGAQGPTRPKWYALCYIQKLPSS